MIETREGYGELGHRCLAVKALAQGPFDVEGPITLEDSESRLEVFTRFVKIAQEIGPHLEWFQEREGGGLADGHFRLRVPDAPEAAVIWQAVARSDQLGRAGDQLGHPVERFHRQPDAIRHLVV